LGIATVGFAHLAMTQYTAAPLNYNLSHRGVIVCRIYMM
jgi:hypothetical protein